MCLGGWLSLVLLALPQIALYFFGKIDLGLLTGWRGNLQIDRFVAHIPALGPREAQVHNQMFTRAFRGNRLHFFPIRCFKKMPFYSWQVHFVRWAELAKHLQSGGFYAGNAALGLKEPHNGNWAWLRTLRRGCACFVFHLAPYLNSLMPGRWPCGLWARRVGTCCVAPGDTCV